MNAKTQKYLKKIIEPIVSKHLPSARIILYGSRARGDESAGSDIDIALDTGSTIGAHSMNHILNDIEESLLPILYDVVDFNSISENLKAEILKDGIVWKN